MNEDVQKGQPSKNYQFQVFLDGEGDKWFERNEAALRNAPSNFETSTIKRVLQNYEANLENILEIGCSNGVKLNDLCEYFNSRGFGVDPSKQAVEDGNKKFSNLRLSVSTASNLPFESNFFDLVIFGFCLYLVDRSEILKAVAEADRVLKTGGFIAIVDFDPNIRQKIPYHHKLGLYSYKSAYSDYFTAGGNYYLVAKESFSHQSNCFAVDSSERISVCILYKEPEFC